MKILGFVIPWSGAVIAPPDPIETAPEIPPVEISPPDMTPFELQFTDAFPDPAAPEHINNGQTFQWPQLADFVTQKTNDAIDHYITSTGGNPNEADVQSWKALLQISRNEEQTAWSSLVSMLQMFQYSFALRTNQSLQTLWAVASNVLDALPVWRDLAVADAATYTRAVASLLHAEIVQTEQRVDVRILQAVAATQQWAIDNVLIPLGRYIVAEQQRAQTAEAHITQVDTPTQISAAIAPLVASAAAIPALKTAVAALQAESANCTKPMCDTMGPKTDLGKLLKALSVGADLALFAELADLRESDLQSLFGDLATWAGKVVDAFDTTFIEGGGRLRDVLGAVGL